MIPRLVHPKTGIQHRGVASRLRRLFQAGVTELFQRCNFYQDLKKSVFICGLFCDICVPQPARF